jgi:hypothetical protein
MKTHYRGATRQEMARAGRALPKKEYRCAFGCGYRGTHDQMHHHQVDLCHWRKGSTVKRPQ